MKPSSICIQDSVPQNGLSVLTRFKSSFEIRNGVFTEFERMQLRYPSAKIYYSHPDPKFQAMVLSRNPFLHPFQKETVDEMVSFSGKEPWDFLREVPTRIQEDIELSKSIQKWNQKLKLKSKRFELVGKSKHLYLHPDSIVYPSVVLDTTKGSIVVGKNVTISPFSFIEGPIYIGDDSSIDNAKLGGGTVIGNNCRMGGEIENSIIQDYSNKHHEGFLGHSLVGSWVNLGALATTSDLKNNYGLVRIQIGSQTMETGTIKFGSLIGDFSKIAIGVMLNTGTVVDLGSNLFSPRIAGYTPSFSWGDSGQKYRRDEFIADTKKIMARRKVQLNSAEESWIHTLMEKAVSP